jgi:hypothetical protein
MAEVFDIELSTAGMPINALIASMCRSTRRVTFADRAALYAQGEPAITVFVILDGFLKTTCICENATELTIELLKSGDIAGRNSHPPPAIGTRGNGAGNWRCCGTTRARTGAARRHGGQSPFGGLRRRILGQIETIG